MGFSLTHSWENPWKRRKNFSFPHLFKPTFFVISPFWVFLQLFLPNMENLRFFLFLPTLTVCQPVISPSCSDLCICSCCGANGILFIWRLLFWLFVNRYYIWEIPLLISIVPFGKLLSKDIFQVSCSATFLNWRFCPILMQFFGNTKI